MLILSRKIQESIIVETSDGKIEITICAVKGDQVKIGFDAPEKVDIWRSELTNESSAA